MNLTSWERRLDSSFFLFHGVQFDRRVFQYELGKGFRVPCSEAGLFQHMGGVVAAEEEKAIAFLRENYNGEAAAYLAAAVDFHNAECAVRAAFSGGNAPYKRGGSVSGEALLEGAKSASYAEIPSYLATPMQAAATLFQEGNASGVSVGMIFLSAYYAHLTPVAKSKWLKNALYYEIDAKNIATVLRSRDMALAEPMLLSGGKLCKKQLAVLLSDRAEEQADKLGEYDYRQHRHAHCQRYLHSGSIQPAYSEEINYTQYGTDYNADQKSYDGNLDCIHKS